MNAGSLMGSLLGPWAANDALHVPWVGHVTPREGPEYSNPAVILL